MIWESPGKGNVANNANIHFTCSKRVSLPKAVQGKRCCSSTAGKPAETMPHQRTRMMSQRNKWFVFFFCDVSLGKRYIKPTPSLCQGPPVPSQILVPKFQSDMPPPLTSSSLTSELNMASLDPPYRQMVASGQSKLFLSKLHIPLRQGKLRACTFQSPKIPSQKNTSTFSAEFPAHLQLLIREV